MGWFKHRHWWRHQDRHAITRKDGVNEGMIIFQDCACGAVRTIQYTVGEMPIVRNGKNDDRTEHGTARLEPET